MARRVSMFACTIVGVTASALVATAGPASAAPIPGPSARQVAAAEHAVTARQIALDVVHGRLTSARAALAQLNVQAEIRIEAYDRTMVQLQQAQAQVRLSRVAVARADRELILSQAAANQYAATAYTSYGGLGAAAALFSGSGPSTLLNQAGLLDAVARQQHDVIGQFNRARQAREQAARQAEAAARATAVLVAAAARDRTAAQAAVTAQQQAIGSLTVAEQRAVGALAGARAQAATLAQQRAAAIAAARAAAIAAAAAARAAAARAAAAQAAAAWAAAHRPQITAPAGPPPAWQRPIIPGSGAPPARSQPPVFASPPQTVPSAAAQIAVQWAYAEVGKPYLWGAAGPDSFDCSGLTMFVWAHAGVALEHYTGYQWTEGVQVSINQLLPGDLVFFGTNPNDPSTIHHVGIYVGNGEMIDAPHTGAFVRVEPVWWSQYVGAVRPG